MKRLRYTHILTLMILCISLLPACTELDNYDEPEWGTIYGKLIDSVTGEPMLTEQPGGFRIRYIEQGYQFDVSPQNFHGKADGTFERSDIVPATYKVLPIEGPFIPVIDSATVVVPPNGRAEVNFTVTPYLNVNASAVASGTTIEVTYTLSRPQFTSKIQERKTLCSDVPTVSHANGVFIKHVTTTLSGISDEVILSTTYKDVITGLQSGKTYWVRAAARVNASGRFNYSPVFEVKLP
jgi:hypothetical protein